MQLLYTKRKCRNHGFLLAFFGDFLSLLKESYPPEATKKEKDHGPPKATFTNIARHCEASAHTACGNSSPTVEHQASSTAHVAAA